MSEKYHSKPDYRPKGPDENIIFNPAIDPHKVSYAPEPSALERFYEKPQSQEELVENMRILKELSEDINDTKVIIKLNYLNFGRRAEKQYVNGDKFIFMEDEDGRKYVIALPIDKNDSHANILNVCEKIYKKKLKALGGGHIYIEQGSLVISDTSGSYGEAPKAIVKQILQERFPDIKIRAYLSGEWNPYTRKRSRGEEV